MTFREYLQTRKTENTPVGDLASDALRDSGWKADTADSLRTRLRLMSAHPSALGVLREAIADYERV